MIGMMNSRAESFEFYASNQGKEEQLSAEDTKAFTEPQDKRKRSYTQDGRIVVEGKAVEDKEAVALWSNILLRSAVNQMPIVNEKKGKKELKKQSKQEEEE